MAQSERAPAPPPRGAYQPYVPPTQTLREFTTLGLVPLFHEGSVGVVAAGLLFFALATVLARVGQRKLG